MAQTYAELKSHIDQLWKIIEQQDTQIQELKKTNNGLSTERDELQEKLLLVLSKESSTQQQKSFNTQQENTIDTNPVLPARSPYRSFNTSDADINSLSKDKKYQQLSSTTSLSHLSISSPTPPTSISTAQSTTIPLSPQEPISPKIIQQDAKLFAQYQSAVLKRDIIETATNSGQQRRQQPISLIPSKSSTLPCQSHEARLAQRKQHNSMVFPSSTVIPGKKKKDEFPPAPPPHHPLSLDKTASQQRQTMHHTTSDMKLSNISDITVKVIGSILKSNEKGKDVVSFILSVGKLSGDLFEELWRVQKLYSDFLDLDLKLKSQLGSSRMNKMTRLPEKQLFTTRSPNKLDQRRVALEKYLHHIITLSMDDISDFCEFLSTDVIEDSGYINQSQGKKEGYLTKRGKNFGGWKTRYFTLKKDRLDYYEAKDGTKLGSISMEGAQIGRQTPPTGTADENESGYRHAILILEYKKTSLGNYVRHILCASSDSERDEWITALLQAIQSNSDTNNNNNNISNGDTASSGLSRSNSSKEKQRKKSSSSDKSRKLSKGEIRTVSATPISHLRMDTSQTVDMEKLTSVPSNNDYPSTTPLAIDPSSSESMESINNGNTIKSPVSISSVDSPLTPRQHNNYNYFGTSPDRGNNIMGLHQQQLYQQRNSLAKTDISLEERAVSPQSRSESPIPTQSFDRRESDDSTNNSGSNGSQQQDKKPKNKSANRMTLWGKKVFGNQQRSTSTSPTGTSDVTNNGILHFSTSPPSSGTISSSSQQDSSQQRGTTPKSLRNILSRPSHHHHHHQDNDDPPKSPVHNKSPELQLKIGKQQLIPSLSKSAIVTSTRQPKQQPIFGVPLEEAVRISSVSDGYPLPAIVFRCIEYLDAKNAILEEGLYRLSGSNVVLQKLKKRFNEEGDIALLQSKEEYDVHAIAGLLKMWLRELPVSVLTRELRPEFIQVIDLLERKDRINELGRLVSELPLANYTLLRILTSHLICVVKHSDVNLMTLRNIGIVFSLTLGIPGTIFNLFLSEFDYIFWTNKMGDAAPRRLEEDEQDDNVDDDTVNDTAHGDQAGSVSKHDDSDDDSDDDGDTAQNNTSDTLLAPISSVVVPRRYDNKKMMAVKQAQGRNNRNSVLYIDAAPNAIVDLEKHTNDGTHVAEEDEEVDDLALDDDCQDEITPNVTDDDLNNDISE
ncbi:uncharacterized protein BX664DRAFT_320502 [Halteromyces radiatus]|uniref:uncharacterized protein n=1 Tax=Halteromyces radiatus TaxID=101107 RepID=UPI002220D164|nr:uncharacterized protein BX664DRAFT_320502 [Halteromyces radiatus]KAI8099145.1 hypothetical protein BX664DRAFT_320502 [Halteromyces radiatus]